MQSFMMHNDRGNPYMAGGVQGVPPSKLGFVCKPDMPPHINILFRARPPLEYIELPNKGKSRPYSGVLGFHKEILSKFETNPPQRHLPDQSKYIQRLKSMVEKIEQHKLENKEKSKEWNPKNDPNVTGDPYKTLFVYRLDFKTDEKKLKREFEMYGPIKRVRIIRDSEGKSRGYGFIEFEHKSDFKNAYKRADRKRVDEARVSVDYERGRTEKNWRPRKLGGGRGDTRSFPHWLEKEVREIKEMYPELVAQFKKEEKKDDKKSRSRSRDYSPNSRRNVKTEQTLKVENNQMQVEEERKGDVISSNKGDLIPNELPIQNNQEASVVDINYEKMDVEDQKEISHKDGQSNGKSDKKKDRKEKKEKKGKKDKKDKKGKKDKKQKTEKTVNDWEAGEITSD